MEAPVHVNRKSEGIFAQYGMDEKIPKLISSATVELAAAIGCEPQRIAKTLAFKVKDKPILIAVAGDARIDNRKFKEHFSAKAKMLTPEEVIAYTGYAVGGVCPFAVSDAVDIYLDESLKRFHSVFPACGSSNSGIELTIAELENIHATPTGSMSATDGAEHHRPLQPHLILFPRFFSLSQRMRKKAARARAAAPRRRR